MIDNTEHQAKQQANKEATQQRTAPIPWLDPGDLINILNGMPTKQLGQQPLGISHLSFGEPKITNHTIHKTHSGPTAIRHSTTLEHADKYSP